MQAAYVVGMGVGAIMTLVATYVLFTEKALGVPAIVFTVLGVLLIGMSVWSQFRVEINGQGAAIEVIQAQLDETAVVVQTVAEQVDVAAEALEVGQAQFDSLASVLLRRGVVRPVELQGIVGPGVVRPTIDRNRLNTTSLRLDSVMQAQPARRLIQ